MRVTKVVSAASMLAALVSPAFAAEGDILVRLRGTIVAPDVDSTVSIGGKAKVDDSIIPEVDFTYFATSNIAFELIVATTKHHAYHDSGTDLGSVWLLPPTLTAQYHFNPEGSFRPYAGAGLNYTIFYNANSGAIPGSSFENNFGWALQAGADIALPNSPVFLNVDVKKLFLSTKWTSANPAVSANVDLDPWIISVGAGIKL
jgi:outer membrane protein